MAKPTFYPDWATLDTTLPATGQTNKVRPREQIRTVGWDKGQIPTAEEFNWILNNQGLWIRYFSQEVVESLPNTYLPQNGTQIQLSGDLQGTITFNGSTVGTGSITVLDNSHQHLSANISDATVGPTPNVLAKRGSQGDLQSSRSFYNYAPVNDNVDYWMYDQTTGTQTGSLAWVRSNNSVILYLGTAAIQRAGIYIYGSTNASNTGFVDITNPRSTTGQEVQPNSLVRFDYLVSQVNNLQNNLNNYANYANGTFVQDVRLGATYTKIINKNQAIVADGGGVVIGYYFEGDNPQGDTLYMKPIQKMVNGNWYTVGQL